jgi:bifunctional DNA-binding transcriptional regulator/antitoxin component of YhaV-PrlF toxin-antitoxin module
LAEVSINANSYHTTVPAGIINQFNLKEGDQLDWSIEAKGSKLVIVVSPTKQKD